MALHQIITAINIKVNKKTKTAKWFWKISALWTEPDWHAHLQSSEIWSPDGVIEIAVFYDKTPCTNYKALHPRRQQN